MVPGGSAGGCHIVITTPMGLLKIQVDSPRVDLPSANAVQKEDSNCITLTAEEACLMYGNATRLIVACVLRAMYKYVHVSDRKKSCRIVDRSFCPFGVEVLNDADDFAPCETQLVWKLGLLRIQQRFRDVLLILSSSFSFLLHDICKLVLY